MENKENNTGTNYGEKIKNTGLATLIVGGAYGIVFPPAWLVSKGINLCDWVLSRIRKPKPELESKSTHTVSIVSPDSNKPIKQWDSSPTEVGAKPPASIVFSSNFRIFNPKYTNPATIEGVRLLESPVGANDIVGKNIEEDDNTRTALLDNFKLGGTPIHFAAIDRPSQRTTEYFGVFEMLMDGKILNSLLYSNASYKDFGEDTYDIYNDWGAINRENEDMIARRMRHQGMGRVWDLFMRDKDFFRFIIGRDNFSYLYLDRSEPRPMVLAIMRWIKTPNRREFIYDLPNDDIYADLLVKFLSEKQGYAPYLPNPQCYNPTVGVWTMVHFSPDARVTWPQKIGYKRGEHNRVNGPTQAAVQTLRWDHNQPEEHIRGVLNGQFIKAAEAYIEANAVSL